MTAPSNEITIKPRRAGKTIAVAREILSDRRVQLMTDAEFRAAFEQAAYGHGGPLARAVKSSRAGGRS